MLFHTMLATPLGAMYAVADLDGVYVLDFEGSRYMHLHRNTYPSQAGSTSIFTQLERELAGYFSGTCPHFTLPIHFSGTAFQIAVWQALHNITYGTTASYKEVAQSIGRPLAVRAVGCAIGKNPLSLLLPCHRVIGVSGHLTGYAGGLERKAWLLRHESREQGDSKIDF